MNIDWASLGLVAVTTVVAAIAIVGIFSIGVLALTSDSGRADAVGVDGGGTAVRQASVGAKLAGYSCVAISGLLVLYGLYLIIPQFH